MLHVIRKHAEGTSYSRIGAVGLFIGSLSNPATLILVPVLALDFAFSKSRTDRAVSGLLSAAITLYWILTFSRSPPEAKAPDFQVIVHAFVYWFHFEPKTNITVVVISIVALLVIPLISLLFRSSRHRQIAFMVSYFGLSSYALYMFSPRFTSHIAVGGPFLARYHTILAVCAVLEIELLVVWRSVTLRQIIVGFCCGFSFCLAFVAIYSSVTGPLKLALNKYSFLLSAQHFRETCSSEPPMVFEKDEWSPAIFCKRQSFPIGFSKIQDYQLWKAQSNPEDRIAGGPRRDPRMFSGSLFFWRE